MSDLFTSAEIDRIKLIKSKLTNDLRRKFDDFAEHPTLATTLFTSCVLSGGASASVYYNQTPNDYDLYFKDLQSLDYIRNWLNSDMGLPYVKSISENYTTNILVNGKCITHNAITLKNDVQLVMMDVSSMIDNFDFIHCNPKLDILTDTYYISPLEYRAIGCKHLIRNNSNGAVSKARMQKFKERGWTYVK